MPRIEINGNPVEVKDGSSVLAACRQAGIEVPTLCHMEGYERFTSCMLCLVRDIERDRLIPSCSALVRDGMAVETDSDAVREARRAALELLLSEHVGDCEGPCRRACPADMNIPLMIRQIAAGNYEQAIRTVKRDIALPAVLGRICPAPCEAACRRGKKDAPVSICLLKRIVADIDLESKEPWKPTIASDSGKSIAIVGAGPTGLAAAYYARRFGHRCVIFDAGDEPGGMLRRGVPEEMLSRDLLSAEIALITACGIEIRSKTVIGKDTSLNQLRGDYDAVVLAIGAEEAAARDSFELKTGPKGILADSATHETSIEGIFAGGDAVRAAKRKMAVRAVADGKAIAHSVNGYLRDGVAIAGPRRFDSVIGRLREGEIDVFMADADDSARLEPGGGRKSGFTREEAQGEALRCMHCDCRKPVSCRLRELAAEYGANQQHYKGDRPAAESIRQRADIIYEPGKCIKCGICVRITEREKERLGLTFIGRGFDVRIGVPLNGTLEEGLQSAARKCVESCPTGALCFPQGEDTI